MSAPNPLPPLDFYNSDSDDEDWCFSYGDGYNGDPYSTATECLESEEEKNIPVVHCAISKCTARIIPRYVRTSGHGGKLIREGSSQTLVADYNTPTMCDNCRVNHSGRTQREQP